jgi:crotonobetainyl-CoA:carnitine CoA-transferase CaiB-like acyl-CoA transferase
MQTMGALDGVRVLDLSRVLAGPWCTQLLADLGATVVKVERPGEGDDTRQWGPPWRESTTQPGHFMASYFMSANRGKQSVAIDIAKPRGADLVRALARQSDVFIENFKVGGLAKYGLGYADLQALNPRLIYCSITGYGQDGPYAGRPGYDFIVQGMGGLMGITGVPDGEPMRAGVALTDIMTGMYACTGILAALHQRARTGQGQHVDAALLDVQVATMANQAVAHLATGQDPVRYGNAHASIVPYQAFATRNGTITVASGNNGQFRKLCEVLGEPGLADDERYRSNGARVANREMLIAHLQALLAPRDRDDILAALEAGGVPCGPVNKLSEVFADPQVRHRGMAVTQQSATMGDMPAVRCPLRLSDSAVGAALPPPELGTSTDAVLSGLLGLGEAEVARLREAGVVG